MSQSSKVPVKKPTRTRERKPRGRGLRTRTGCLTCRKRHLKCNEAKPVCGPCGRSSHACVYADPHASQSDSTSASTSDSASRLISAAASVSHSAPPSIAPTGEPEGPDSIDPFDLAARSPWSNNEPNDEQLRFLSRATTWPKQAPTSNPRSIVRIDSHQNRDTSPWAPVLADLESYHITQGPRSQHSERMSPSAQSLPQPVQVNVARSSAGSDDMTMTANGSGPPSNPDAAVARWFGLVAGDTDFQNGVVTSDNDWSHQGRAAAFSQHTGSIALRNQPWEGCLTSELLADTNPPLFQSNWYRPSKDRMPSPQPPPWKSREALTLQPLEIEVFDNFVTKISHWLDLFDPMQSFSTHVPHLAMYNVGLLNAILALSIRHSSLVPRHVSKNARNRNDAMQYYHEALRYIQNAMRHDSYNRSDELLATCLIISAYEMLDGSHKDWERHLQGFHRLQRSQLIHGESSGIKQAVWWAWLCQDIWAAFREKRRPFASWHPSREYGDMTPYELAARSVHLMARVVSYCSQTAIEHGEQDGKARGAEADHLSRLLDEWRQHLPLEFSPLPMPAKVDSLFKPIWVHPPVFNVALQLYCAAKILLIFHRPCLRGIGEFMQQRSAVTNYTETICGLASTLTDDASSVMSSQCLFIAGLCIQDQKERMEVVRLLKDTKERAGWPVNPLSDDLQMIWNGLSDNPLP